MTQFLTFVNGKKTYITAFLMVLSAWISVYLGTMDASQAITLTISALSLSSLRHAVAKVTPYVGYQPQALTTQTPDPVGQPAQTRAA